MTDKRSADAVTSSVSRRTFLTGVAGATLATPAILIPGKAKASEQIVIANWGGAVAEAAGLVCTVGSNLELGVANAAMIHLALATPAIDADTFPCDILSPFYYDEDILTEPLPIKAGEARAPQGPGLGVELDEEKVAYFRVK